MTVDTDTEYVWQCVLPLQPWLKCNEFMPHDVCRWVLETTPDPDGGRWGDTGAPAPLNRDPGAATTNDLPLIVRALEATIVATETELRAALKQPDVFTTPGMAP